MATEKVSEEQDFGQEKELLKWESEERVFSGRSRDYYSTVLVLAILVGIVLFFIEGLMPVLVIGAIVFVMFALARTQPGMAENKITNMGVWSGGQRYRWEELVVYWVDGEERRILHILTRRRWPVQLVLVLPKEGIEESEVKRIMGRYLEWQPPERTRMDRVVEWFKQKVPLE